MDHYVVNGTGHISRVFNGGKQKICMDDLQATITDFERGEIVGENVKKIRRYLVEQGFGMIEAGSFSSYWTRPDCSVDIRLTEHVKLSTLYLEHTINAYSEKKDGHLEIIKQIEGACRNRKERCARAVA